MSPWWYIWHVHVNLWTPLLGWLRMVDPCVPDVHEVLYIVWCHCRCLNCAVVLRRASDHGTGGLFEGTDSGKVSTGMFPVLLISMAGYSSGYHGEWVPQTAALRCWDVWNAGHTSMVQCYNTVARVSSIEQNKCHMSWLNNVNLSRIVLVCTWYVIPGMCHESWHWKVLKRSKKSRFHGSWQQKGVFCSVWKRHIICKCDESRFSWRSVFFLVFVRNYPDI